jgi:uncharacterized protein (DUF342 family)
MPSDTSDDKTAIQMVTEVETPSYRLTVALHDNEMECRATFTPKDDRAAITSEELLTILKKEEIFDVDSQLVDDFCSRAGPDGPQKEILLAKGIVPEPGTDGWLEIIVLASTDEARYQSDEKDKVDYKNRHSFENVKPDTIVGRIHPPREGEPGRTVKNNPIPPMTGKELKLRPGRGIRLDEDGITLIAEIEGRLIHEGDTLSVSEEMVINGNVDFSVGHIDFAGVVVVKGDVLDDFNVKATKGIEISGAVGACQIISGGDILIGSVYGKDTGVIKCLGTLQAHHLCNVSVECTGDVIVTKEIRDSIIKTLGVISIENGNICGGDVIALRGMEVKKVGSPIGVATSLTAGISYLDSDREKELQKRLEALSVQEEQINYTLGNIALNDLDSLNDGIKKRYDVLTATREKISKEMSILLKEMKAYNPAENTIRANPKINVKGMLFEGVTIELGNHKEKIDEEKDGPFSIIESLQHDRLLYLSLSPLQVHAEETERTAEDGGEGDA